MNRTAAAKPPAERQGVSLLRRFASPAVVAVLRRRLIEFLGLLCALAGLALILALASHDPADPSLSTATGRAPVNLVGPAGAYVSDLLIQGLGWAAYLPGVALLTWAWKFASHRGIGLVPARVALLLAAMPMLAAALTLPPWPEGMAGPGGPGGAGGWMVAEAVTGTATSLLGPFGQILGQVVLVATGLGLSGAALALAPTEWLTLGRFAGRAAGRTAGGAARLSGAGARRAAEGARRGWFRLPSFRLFRFGRRPAAGGPQPGADLAAVLSAAEVAAAASPGVMARLPVGGAPLPEGRARRAEPAPPPEVEALADAVAGARVVPPRVAGAVPEPRRSAAARQQTLDFEEDGPWRLPPLNLLAEPKPGSRAAGRPSEEALQGNARMLETVLEDYGVRGRIVEIRPGPVVTLYELEPAAGTKSARVIGLADDIARSMSVIAVRIATVPGRNVIGIEMPNARRETVYLSEMFGGEDWTRHPGRLPLALGKDIGGTPVVADLARMPHLLIAGTTGSGKSVAINTMILSLLWRFAPDECRFIMIDPKMLELSVYDRIPHLLAPVVTEPPKAIVALKWTVREMERRYRAMSQLGVRNIGGYNERVVAARGRGEVLTRRVQTGFDPETGRPVFEDQPLALEPLPMIVVVIDEMADLMIVAGKEIEAAVQRLAQMARAAGIHVIMATQRPSVDVITGTIKANFPTRISFQVTSKIDSRTILGEQGAEQLLGQGDMLYMAGGGRVSRVHGPFVSDEEVERVVAFLREQGEPSYVEEVTESEDDAILGGDAGLPGMLGGNTDAEASLYDQAVALVTREGKASTSFVQRHLAIGYNRAAKLIEQMEKEGVVGPANHVGKREVLAPGPREE
jgi:S-DNA-T family DNA segregation ATPase FtsK/SpoIIIE